MKRYKELVSCGKSISDQNKIDKILRSNNFNWIIDSEIENSIIEIKNDTIIWHDGIFYSGVWKYGIFKSGKFYGIFENGIFENGEFNGKWISGINLLI